MIAVIYYFLTFWRIAYLVTVTIPAFIALLLGFKMVYDTPKYFICKKNPAKVT
jgi:hypothetical protein